VGPSQGGDAEGGFVYTVKGIETLAEAEIARKSAHHAAILYGVLSAVSFFTWAYQVRKPWARRAAGEVSRRVRSTIGVGRFRYATGRERMRRIGSGVPESEYELSETTHMRRPLIASSKDSEASLT